jgi:hypothetical protein
MSAPVFQAVLGGLLAPDGAIGFESIARAVRVILARDLNDEIDRVAERWRTSDLQMQEMGLDPEVGQIDVEHIPVAHLHEGPHESLLDAPASAFPNVSMMSYLTAPSTSQGFDQFDSNDISLFIETMVVAGPVPKGLETNFETIVHRRIQRTTEAVNNVVRRDKTLLGTVLPQQNPARGGIGKQSWVRPDHNEKGPRHIWHGSRLQYTLQRASTTG